MSWLKVTSKEIAMFEKILIALDGSDTAEMVLSYAEEIAAKLGSETVLVSAVNPLKPNEENLRSVYLGQLVNPIQDHCREFGALAECKVSTQILLGKPADEILRYADRINASIIAMTNRGSSSTEPWSLGSTAAKILRAVNKPVLLVRVPAREIALHHRRLIQRILVPLDGSRIGESALPYAADLAQALGAEVILFQVAELIKVASGYDRVFSGALPPGDELLKTAASNYLQETARSLKDKQIKTSSVVVIGSAAEQIIDYGEANRIDLIAISTHGESGIGRWVFGSVTDKVLHSGTTAVLVVKSTQR
jgi:nucleotide-binding universal stress UspA family protein